MELLSERVEEKDTTRRLGFGEYVTHFASSRMFSLFLSESWLLQRSRLQDSYNHEGGLFMTVLGTNMCERKGKKQEWAEKEIKL